MFQGDIVDIARDEGKTEVVVAEGQHQLSYELDEGLIEFGTAVDDGDFNRAVQYLEKLEMTAETEAMWRTLARMSLESRQLHIAERCYAALGDVSKAKYLRETLNVADVAADSFGGDGMDAPEVWARLYVLDKQFKAAEGIYLEQNKLDEAIEVCYTTLTLSYSLLCNHIISPAADVSSSSHVGRGAEPRRGKRSFKP